MSANGACDAEDNQWQKYTKAGIEAAKQDKDAQSEKYFLLALKEAEKTGLQDERLARSFNNLAISYNHQNKYNLAEQTFKHALEITKNVYGDKHPEEIAYISQNLAGVYAKEHKDEAAEQLYKQALDINEKVLGSEHPEVAKTLLNLAIFLDHRGKYAQAEPLYQRCLGLEEKQLGADDPVVTAIKKNYADVLYKLKRDSEAKQLEAGKDVGSNGSQTKKNSWLGLPLW